VTELAKPRPALALVLMLGAVISFTAMSAFVKDLREHGMSTFEVMVWRMSPGLPWVWAELRWRGIPVRPRRPRVVALRSLFGGLAMTSNFWAVQMLSLVQHTVLHLSQPVWVALLSPAVLRERLRGAALLALAIALVGATVVILPDAVLQVGLVGALGAFAMPLVPGLVGLSSALFSAVAHMTVRQATAPELRSPLDRDAPADAPETVVFHFTLHVTLVCLVLGFLLGDFSALPTGLDLGGTALRIAGMALCGLIGQLMMSRAYARAEAPAVAIVAYAGIPISALVDLLVWGQSIGTMVLVGASVMVAAGLLLVRAQRQ
jgi:S-adenosylmethionine uptake transporter